MHWFEKVTMGMVLMGAVCGVTLTLASGENWRWIVAGLGIGMVCASVAGAHATFHRGQAEIWKAMADQLRHSHNVERLERLRGQLGPYTKGLGHPQ